MATKTAAREADVERAIANMKTVSVGDVDLPMGNLTAVGMETQTDATGPKVTIYSTVDGTPSQVYPHQLRAALKETLPNGNPKFWVDGMDERDKPPAYVMGTLKCLLHPEHENRAILDKIGLAGRYCNLIDKNKAKSNLRSELDVQEHMRVCHKQELRIIQENESRIEREKRDQRDNMIAEALTAALTKDK